MKPTITSASSKRVILQISGAISADLLLESNCAPRIHLWESQSNSIIFHLAHAPAIVEALQHFIDTEYSLESEDQS